MKAACSALPSDVVILTKGGAFPELLAVFQHAVAQQALRLRVPSGLHLASDLRHSVQHS